MMRWWSNDTNEFNGAVITADASQLSGFWEEGKLSTRMNLYVVNLYVIFEVGSNGADGGEVVVKLAD